MNTEHSSHTSVKTYLAVFGGLAALTAVTVLLAGAGLPHKSAVVAASIIALLKVSLIALFFMHLKSENKGIYALLIGAFFFVMTLILVLIPDIGSIQ